MFDLSCHTLSQSPHGAAVIHVLQAALAAADPYSTVKKALRGSSGQRLVCNEPDGESQNIELGEVQRIILVGAGKAAVPMAYAVAGILGERVGGGLLIVKDGHAAKPKALPHIPAMENVEIIEAAHPVPDQRGVAASRRLAVMLNEADDDDLVICLISGGGSALLLDPVTGVRLEELQRMTRSLLASGATINEINTLRKHLDLFKGGGLARRVAPARLVTLILSDVLGDPLDVIASGPTVGDPTTYADALEILEKRGLIGETPPAILAHLQAGVDGKVPETPRPGDPLFQGVINVIVGSLSLSLDAAYAEALATGFEVHVLEEAMQGEARQRGVQLAGLAAALRPRRTGEPPLCLLAGGETTVTLKGNGRGGRNQELALAAVERLAGLPDTLLVTLATDGSDGPTDAAGAVVSGETLKRARNRGLNPGDFLARNDAYHFFARLDDLLRTGPTQTNVNDIALILRG